MTKLKCLCVMLILFVCVGITQAQEVQKKLKKTYKDALSLIDNDSVLTAKILFDRLYNINPTENLAFKLGFCFMKSDEVADNNLSIEYLEVASKNVSKHYKDKFSQKAAPLYTNFYLGMAHRFVGNYEQAIDAFKTYKESATNKEKKSTRYSMIESQMQWVEQAKNAHFDSKNVTKKNIEVEGIENLDVNFPLFAHLVDRLVFVKSSNVRYPADINFDVDEEVAAFDNLYVSNYVDGRFVAPQNILESVGLLDKIFQPTSITANGSELFFIVDDGDDGNIYSSVFDSISNSYQKAEPLKKLNTKRWEAHASVSADGSEIYFSSDRKGSVGGFDIWYSRRDEDGKWKKPSRLDVVNTSLDEEMPYIARDGKTLYFSSETHNGMGGADVFFSRFNDSVWSAPTNLGLPYNTFGNDMAYIFEGYNTFAFCPTNSNKRRVGFEDCKCIEISKELAPDSIVVKPISPILAGSESEIAMNERPVEEVREQPVEEQQPVAELIERPVEEVRDQPVETPKEDTNVVETQPVGTEKSDGSIVGNPEYGYVLFGFDKYNLENNYKTNLDKIIASMKSETSSVLEIYGYTDPVGSYEYNLALSKRRANTVKTYAINNGISESRIYVVGKGKENQLTPYTKDDATRKYNRRVIYSVLPSSSDRVEVSIDKQKEIIGIK